MPTSLIVGASRGLGRALALSLSSGSLGQPHKVYGTVRSPPRDQGDDLLKTDKVELIDGVDLTSERCAKTIVEGLEGNKVDYVWLVAGLLVPEVGPCLLLYTRPVADGSSLSRNSNREASNGMPRSTCTRSAPSRRPSSSKPCPSHPFLP